MTVAIAYALALLAVQPSAPLDEKLLCSLADALLVWSPPEPGNLCGPPFPMIGCGQRGIFAKDRRPVFRFTYGGQKVAGRGYPKDPCAARGIWLYGANRRMPPGSSTYIDVDLNRTTAGELRFMMTFGFRGGTLGCGSSRGVARLEEGRWILVDQDGKLEKPGCTYTKEQVLGCKDGGLTSR